MTGWQTGSGEGGRREQLYEDTRRVPPPSTNTGRIKIPGSQPKVRPNLAFRPNTKVPVLMREDHR